MRAVCVLIVDFVSRHHKDVVYVLDSSVLLPQNLNAPMMDVIIRETALLVQEFQNVKFRLKVAVSLVRKTLPL